MARDENRGGTIKSDETLFRIIDALKETGDSGVTELADRLGLAKSTVHKHLVGLERNRYVVKDNGRYRLGLEFLHIGVHVRNQYEFYHAAKDQIDRLAEVTNEAAWLIAHENGLGIFIYGVPHNESFTFDSTIGTWAYLHSNSAGKAILAHLPEKEVDEIIDIRGLPAQTENTITDRDELFNQFDTIRERGYAMNFQEDLRGLHAVATPVIKDDRPIAAVTVAGAANRLTRERIEDELYEDLLETVDNIELRLAYQ
ncbi:IclR family transcriptional regulator [Natronorubrum sp. FCH18a]|uniref:IclR family transcriptional regulator n=1 Tax=Natronorubrum sp. FCH18a TaxID=3447018 RepID=UPI003F519F3B